LGQRNACKAALEFCEGINRGTIFDSATVDRYVAEMRASPAVARGARLLMLAKNNQEASAQTGAEERSR
jgi:hypothetical protein